MQAGDTGITNHTVTVSGQTIAFTLTPGEPFMTCDAPGVCTFNVASLDEARDMIRSAFAAKALADDAQG